MVSQRCVPKGPQDGGSGGTPSGKHFCTRKARRNRSHGESVHSVQEQAGMTAKREELRRCSRTAVSVLLRLVGWWSARLQHFLHQVEADSRFALILRNGKVVQKVEVAHVGAVGVAVLVHQPFPLGGVGVTRADVLGLQVLQLTVDGVAVRHLAAFPLLPGQRPQMRTNSSRFSRGRQAAAGNLQARAVADEWRHSDEVAWTRGPRAQKRKRLCFLPCNWSCLGDTTRRPPPQREPRPSRRALHYGSVSEPFTNRELCMLGPVVSEGSCTSVSGNGRRSLQGRRRPNGVWCRGGGEHP